MARAKFTRDRCCSFCGKTHEEVVTLIAGPGVSICDACVTLCGEIIDEGPTPPLERSVERQAPRTRMRDRVACPLRNLRPAVG